MEAAGEIAKQERGDYFATWSLSRSHLRDVKYGINRRSNYVNEEALKLRVNFMVYVTVPTCDTLEVNGQGEVGSSERIHVAFEIALNARAGG